MNLFKYTQRFKNDKRAVVALEFALVIPVFLSMLFGLVEITRYTLISQKVQKVAFTMADIVTQGEKVCKKDIDDLMLAAPSIMSPNSFTGVRIFFTSFITKPLVFPRLCNNVPVNGSSCVVWKQSRTVGRVQGAVSLAGERGKIATPPANLLELGGSNYIVVEIFYAYKPIFPGTALVIPSLAAKNLYALAMMKPRLGNLDTYNGRNCR